MVWNMLKKSQGAINLSFDLWTSPNGLGLNAIIAHFVDSEYNIRTILIGLREVMGEHSGENIGQTVVEVIREFQLEASLNVFVLDNARSNDTAVYYILNELDLEDTHLEDHCRLRCLGHIINLAAQDFIFGKNSKEWLKEHTAVENTDDLEEQQKSWVSQGLIGHLQNLVSLIRSSPQRRQAFRNLAGGDSDNKKQNLMVIQNNTTRWNSTYIMLNRALELKDQIQVYVNNCLAKRDSKGQIADKPIHKIAQLSEEDWLSLRALKDALQPFHEATMLLQSNSKEGFYGFLWECLPVIEWLMQTLENATNSNGIHTRIGLSANDAWNKVKKYYKLTDNSPFYVAAIVLNPTHKWRYFETHWRDRKPWIKDAKSEMNRLWTRHKIQHQQAINEETSLPTNAHPSSETGPSTSFKSFLAQGYHQDDEGELTDEYRAYCQLPTLQNKPHSLIYWWRDQEPSFPLLAKLAYSILSIPAMSAECERVFSSSKLLVTPTRNRLSPQAIEASECLRNWYRNEVV